MVSQSIQNYLRKIGKKGGIQRAKNLTLAVRSAQARKAVLTRWMNKRFGVDCFEKLGIPGWEIIDSGLHDLVQGNLASVNALAVAEIRPKLRFLGIPVPPMFGPNANIRASLYRALEDQHKEMAHARFCALLERVDSFCHALTAIISIPQHSAHRNRRWFA